MAQPRLKAEFFVTQDGLIIAKAKNLDYDQKKEIYKRDGGKCKICDYPVRFGGRDSSPYELIRSGQVDHIFPRSRGGQNTPENLRLLCLTCNSQKGAK